MIDFWLNMDPNEDICCTRGYFQHSAYHPNDSCFNGRHHGRSRNWFWYWWRRRRRQPVFFRSVLLVLLALMDRSSCNSKWIRNFEPNFCHYCWRHLFRSRGLSNELLTQKKVHWITRSVSGNRNRLSSIPPNRKNGSTEVMVQGRLRSK